MAASSGEARRQTKSQTDEDFFLLVWTLECTHNIVFSRDLLRYSPKVNFKLCAALSLVKHLI